MSTPKGIDGGLPVVAEPTDGSEPAGRQPRARRWLASGTKRRVLAVLLAQALVVVVALAAWQLLVDQGFLAQRDVSTPGSVWSTLRGFAESGMLWTETLETMRATLMAFLIGVPLGVLAGLALAANSFVDKVLTPFLVPLNSLPRIALAPLFIVWFGLTDLSKIVMGVSIVFFVMVFRACLTWMLVEVRARS